MKGIRTSESDSCSVSRKAMSSDTGGSDGWWELSWFMILVYKPCSDSHTLNLYVYQSVGEEDIAIMWCDHFKDILNCVANEVNGKDLQREVWEVI